MSRVTKHVGFQGELPVVFLREGRAYIAFTPALDLSASGSTIGKAKKNFGITLKLFLEELVNQGTVDSVLREMGWSRSDSEWQPPVELRQTASVPFTLPVAA